MVEDLDQRRRERREEREREMGDRTFALGGKTFTYRSASSYMVMEDVVALQRDGRGIDFVPTVERAILDMIEPGQEEEMLAVLHDRDDPFTLADLNDLLAWLGAAQAGRPTELSSPSVPGDTSTSTTSTDGSSSAPAEASEG